VLAAALSVVVVVWQRKYPAKMWRVDFALAISTATVLGVVTFLGSGLGLIAPLTGSVKYLFQTLPLLCLLAASLPQKFCSAASSSEVNGKKHKIALYGVWASAALLGAALVVDASVLFFFSKQSSVAFDAGGALYVLLNSAPLEGAGVMAAVQACGFTAVLLSVLYILGQNLKVTAQNLTRK